jgi:hypothetical protein
LGFILIEWKDYLYADMATTAGVVQQKCSRVCRVLKTSTA